MTKMQFSRRARVFAMSLAASGALLGAGSSAHEETPLGSRPVAADGFAVEYYYKVRWGHFDEFMELYQRNHYPILRRHQQMGRILRMTAAYPINHASETARWDLRYTIVWKDAATAHEDFDDSAMVKEMYPDQAKFRAEEQRRFELLLEHTDVPVFIDDLAEWPK